METNKIGHLILMVSFFVLTFVLGTFYGQINEKKNQSEEVKIFTQIYAFDTIAINHYPTNETLLGPFVCILADSPTIENMFNNLFIPALKKEEVCFTNIYNFADVSDKNLLIGEKNESIQATT